MLRNRILLAVAPLIVLLMVVGGYAVWLFIRLGGAVNTTLHENYTSIAAMRDLRDAAARIDRAAFAYRVGGTSLPQSRSILDEQATLCRRYVDVELAIITEPGERQAANHLRDQDEAFLTAAFATLAPGTGPDTGLQPSLG